MVIDLQEPFRSLYTKGYLQEHEGGRKYICLYNTQEDRTLISYARYLMCVKLGYVLSNEFEVDHRDDDKTNDDINNLQILTQEENLLKQHYNYIMNEQVCYGFVCAYCENPMILTERDVKNRLAQNVEHAFCSRSCAANYNHATNSNCSNRRQTSNTTKEKIKELRSSGLSVKEIASELNVGRSTVTRFS